MKSIIFGFAAATVAQAATWGVIAVGSSGYMNYRHQADGCHAYQILKKNGVPESNIIVLSADDVADSSQNPFRGKLYNKESKKGFTEEVYAGCNIDYKGHDITPELFMAVLSGDSEKASHISGQQNAKVLKSTENDHVFINFVDHGGPGIIAMPSGLMTVKQLQSTLSDMAGRKMYKQLMFYMEACESGSMFAGHKLPDNMYVVTAANATESSWGTYCPPNDIVDGKSMNTCLGDLFSVNWMQDSDAHKITSEEIKKQVSNVVRDTTRSHVTQFGSESFKSEMLSLFQGGQSVALRQRIKVTETNVSSMPVPDLPERTLLARLERAHTADETSQAQAALNREVSLRTRMNERFEEIANLMHGLITSDLSKPVESISNLSCHHEIVQEVVKQCYQGKSVDQYSMRRLGIFAHVCDSKPDLLDFMKSTVGGVCGNEEDIVA